MTFFGQPNHHNGPCGLSFTQLRPNDPPPGLPHSSVAAATWAAAAPRGSAAPALWAAWVRVGKYLQSESLGSSGRFWFLFCMGSTNAAPMRQVQARRGHRFLTVDGRQRFLKLLLQIHLEGLGNPADVLFAPCLRADCKENITNKRITCCGSGNPTNHANGTKTTSQRRHWHT